MAEAVELGMAVLGAYHDTSTALVALSDGRLSRGAPALAALRDEGSRNGDLWHVTIIDVSLAIMLARMATGEVEGSAIDALRQPAFVIGHARGAAKRERAALEALVVALGDLGFEGYRPTVEYEPAKLARHQGRTGDARHHAQMVIDLVAGDPQAPFVWEATALLAEH